MANRNMNNKLKTINLLAVRKAVANYMQSEGCSCCQDTVNHDKHKTILARLLNIPMYKDKSGYNFAKYENEQKK